MEITVKKVWKNPTPGKWPIARVSVDIVAEDVVFTIHGITVSKGRDGKSFIGLPQQQALEKKQDGSLVPKLDPKTNKPIYYPINELSKDAYFKLQDAILAEVDNVQVSAPATRATANTSTRNSRQAAPTTIVRTPEPAVQVGADSEEDPPF